MTQNISSRVNAGHRGRRLREERFDETEVHSGTIGMSAESQRLDTKNFKSQGFELKSHLKSHYISHYIYIKYAIR